MMDMKTKADINSLSERQASMVVETTLYDLVAAVEREMRADTDREVARAVSDLLDQNHPRHPWKAAKSSGIIKALDNSDR